MEIKTASVSQMALRLLTTVLKTPLIECSSLSNDSLDIAHAQSKLLAVCELRDQAGPRLFPPQRRQAAKFPAWVMPPPAWK